MSTILFGVSINPVVHVQHASVCSFSEPPKTFNSRLNEQGLEIRLAIIPLF